MVQSCDYEMATPPLTQCPVFLLEVSSISSLSLLSGISFKVPHFESWVSHLPGLWCIMEGPPNLLSSEVAYFHSFCWPSGLQSFSLTQYQIMFPSPPLPHSVHPVHFPSQYTFLPSLSTCDCFLLSPVGLRHPVLGTSACWDEFCVSWVFCTVLYLFVTFFANIHLLNKYQHLL